jgi:hypothetical protein
MGEVLLGQRSKAESGRDRCLTPPRLEKVFVSMIKNLCKVMPVAAFLCLFPTLVLAQHDPGVRGGVANTAAHFSDATAQNNQTHSHAYPASEANTLIRNFNKLSVTDKQPILDFPSFASIERGLTRAISFCLPAKSRLLAVFSKRSERSARHTKTRPELYS